MPELHEMNLSELREHRAEVDIQIKAAERSSFIERINDCIDRPHYYSHGAIVKLLREIERFLKE